MDLSRSSGILLHPTSLPGPFGIGDIGLAAYRFVDLLAETGQSWWQILPLGRSGYENSPYMCLSGLGGNPMLISPELLIADGLLDLADIAAPPVFPEEQVDFGPVIEHKMRLLERSYRNFKGQWAPTRRNSSPFVNERLSGSKPTSCFAP
jgi:4-alpha-glucanotransferase